MKARSVILALILASVGFTTSSFSQAKKATAPAKAGQTDTFTKLADEFFDQVYFKFNPTQGTAAGLHRYDPQLEDYSRAGVDKQIAALKQYRDRFAAEDTAKWPQERIADRELIVNYINGTLLELESIRQWEKNPDRYSSGISNSAFLIMSRKFASADVRLRSLIAREKQMPAAFEAARANLKNPPQVYTEVALMQLPGIINFFEKDVPLAFKDVHDKKLIAEFGQANAGVVEALRSYQKYLKVTLLPVSKGDFRIGAENYSKKLQYDEMVDIPLDKLLEIGYANLRQNQQWFKETAAKLDSTKTPQQVLEQIGNEHPAPDQLLQSFRNTFDSLQGFINEKKIVTIPSKIEPIVEETPPFERALTFASMDTPGPFEKVAKEAFFNVTLPEPEWTPKRVAEHMAGFNHGTIISTAVHEAYPGHYVQFLWVPAAPSKVRKLLGASSNAEGWAHYCEQMMLDEGYGVPKGGSQDSPEFLKLRLGQLQDALLRNARYIVGIQMHTGKMTFEEGVDFFVNEGYQSRTNGMRETRRGTSDPTYLYYTLGKLEILKLRDDYKKLRGPKFSLEEFHNTFLKQGFPPVKLIRRQMLGNDSPTL
ncbi:MAG: hypothetical protein JWO20_566 [Candidatus Angelobacter sp.]|nr:hypothetical protein [Candidatus Angelobacter sp.]